MTSITCATWNVNSVNAHLEQILSWLEIHNPDIVLLQETKCEDVNFPHPVFERYNICHKGQKTYNGVAILSKYPTEDVVTNFKNNPCPEQSRFIEANIQTPIGLVKIINVYVPNGGDGDGEKMALKLAFLQNLYTYLQELDTATPTLIGGDFNVSPFDIDVFSVEEMEGKTHFSSIEKNKLRQILNSNFIDLYRLANPDSHEFSWWDYRRKSFDRNEGLRIDFLLANPKLADMLKSSSIDTKIRGATKPSDHALVLATFSK
jgi:exodeoxyribonuclease-3